MEAKLKAIQGSFPDFSEALQLAQSYVQSDAGSSLTKSRMIAEKLLVELFKKEMGVEPRKPLLGEMLADNQFTRRIDRRIVSRLNAIRDMGNLGPHGEKVEAADAARVLEDLYTILKWYQDWNGGSSVFQVQSPRRWDLRKLVRNWRQVSMVCLVLASLLLAGLIAFLWVRLLEDSRRTGRIIEAREAIEQQNTTYRQAVVEGDLEGYAGLFAEDGIVLSKGEVIKGRNAIREWAARSMGKGSGPIIQTVELDVRDDLAYEVGIFKRAETSGSYLVVWKKQPDGVWRIQAEVSSIQQTKKQAEK